MTSKIFENLQDELMKVAEEMTGETRDSRFKSWAKTVGKVDAKARNGYAFSGEWINEGTTEMEIEPRVFLVHFNHGSRKYTTGEYAIVTMDADGELHATDIMTDDRERGWALRIRDQVAALLDELSVQRSGPSPRDVLLGMLRERFPILSDDEIITAALNVYAMHTHK
jgi:hypothetical protein